MILTVKVLYSRTGLSLPSKMAILGDKILPLITGSGMVLESNKGRLIAQATAIERLLGKRTQPCHKSPRRAELPEILTRSDSDGTGARLALATQDVAL